jgi:hypothetical protein
MDSTASVGRRPRSSNRRPARALFALLAAIGMSLALAGPAAAQNDPIHAQYCEEGVVNEVTGECEEVSAVQDPGDPGVVSPSTASSDAQGDDGRVVSSLPFTGVDLAVLGVVALVLLGAGFLLRRLSAPRES